MEKSCEELGDALKGIAMDRESNTYIGHVYSGIISKHSPSGEVSEFAKIPLVEGSGLMGLVFGPEGHLFACRVFAEPGIFKISPDGKSVELFSSSSEMKAPSCAVFARNGDMYVSDAFATDAEGYFGGTLFKIDQNGNAVKFLQDHKTLGTNQLCPGYDFGIGANAVLLDESENLFILNSGEKKILRMNIRAGDKPGEMDVIAGPFDDLGLADGLAADSDGNLYTCGFINGTVIQVKKNGQPQLIASEIEGPCNVFVGTGAEEGNLLVTSFSGSFCRIKLTTS